MVAYIFKLLPALIIALCLTSAVHADEAQDLLVEKGVAAYDDGDYQRAKDILLPLAEAGHPKAMNMVGLMTKFGSGLSQDFTTACNWYEKAANQGYPSAMYNLSICYNQGIGRSQDHEQMLHWRILAANEGNIRAIVNLAGADDKHGQEYRKWINKAALQGSVFAKTDLWLLGFKEDVPNISFRDISCVLWNILILDKDIQYCD